MAANLYCTSRNCASCINASTERMVYRQLPQGTHFPAEQYPQNSIIFLIKGELLVNSKEYPGTILRSKDIILHAAGSKMELLVLKDVEYLIYWFAELDPICKEHYDYILEISREPLIYSPMRAHTTLDRLLKRIVDYINSIPKPCHKYVNVMCRELIFLLTTSYPIHQVSSFFYPVSIYAESFHFFVMQNYEKVKNVEEFAQLGGYTPSTFRRLFKNIYGVPVYEWILERKSDNILHDLQHTNDRMTVLCQRYGFDTLSHFSHFCKNSYGDSPRSLRKRLQAGENIALIKRKPLKKT